MQICIIILTLKQKKPEESCENRYFQQKLVRQKLNIDGPVFIN